jgi:hypothetical protein
MEIGFCYEASRSCTSSYYVRQTARWRCREPVSVSSYRRIALFISSEITSDIVLKVR